MEVPHKSHSLSQSLEPGSFKSLTLKLSFLSLSDVWNTCIIQIAYSRSNSGFKRKQSWKVKQISSYAASSLFFSKGLANDLFFGKTGKRSNMKAWLREEKSFTPITASMLLARIHNPTPRTVHCLFNCLIILYWVKRMEISYQFAI